MFFSLLYYLVLFLRIFRFLTPCRVDGGRAERIEEKKNKGDYYNFCKKDHPNAILWLAKPFTVSKNGNSKEDFKLNSLLNLFIGFPIETMPASPEMVFRRYLEIAAFLVHKRCR